MCSNLHGFRRVEASLAEGLNIIFINKIKNGLLTKMSISTEIYEEEKLDAVAHRHFYCTRATQARAKLDALMSRCDAKTVRELQDADAELKSLQYQANQVSDDGSDDEDFDDEGDDESSDCSDDSEDSEDSDDLEQ